MTDLTEGRRLHDRVVQQALHDPLTGLPNRLLFKERLEQATARPLRRRLAVLLLGLDRFRAVNDAHGHATGDDVLTHVAERLQARLDGAQPLATCSGGPRRPSSSHRSYFTRPVSARYSLATSAGSFLSRSTRASSSCIASSVSGFWIWSMTFARSAPALSAVSVFIKSVGL